jgi:hypothetical protein
MSELTSEPNSTGGENKNKQKNPTQQRKIRLTQKWFLLDPTHQTKNFAEVYERENPETFQWQWLHSFNYYYSIKNVHSAPKFPLQNGK